MLGTKEGSGPGIHTQHDSRGPDPEPGRGKHAIYREGIEGDHIGRRAGEKVRYGSMLKVATLNVKSLWKATLHRQLVDYMDKEEINVMCVQETKVPSTTHYAIGDYVFYIFSGEKGRSEDAGIGFVVHKSLKNAMTGVTHHGSRVAAMGLSLASGLLSIMSVYIPQSGRPVEEREGTFEVMAEVKKRLEAKGPVLILGDFNARLHARRAGEGDVLGKHIYGRGTGALDPPEIVPNRDLLVNFCREEGYKVANTWFRKPEAKKVTQRHPGNFDDPGPGQPWDPVRYGEIDMCLAGRGWGSMVKDVESDVKASINSDHYPLLVQLQVKLRAKRNHGNQREKGFHFAGATDEQLTKYDEIFLGLMAEGLTGDIEVDWERIKGAIKKAAGEVMQEKHLPPKKEWISEETLSMLEHRRELIAAGLTQTARELDKDIKAAAREDRVKWMEGKMTGNFWDPVKMLTKPRAPKVVALSRNKGEGEIDSKPCEVYADHLEEVQWGTCETEGPGEGRRLAPQDVHIETGEISKAELDAALRSTKRGKQPGPDAVQADAWIALDKGREILRGFFNQCWEQNKVPDDWRNSRVVGIFKKGDAGDPANYRPISLLQTGYKIYARILAKRLSTGLDGYIRNSQYGFRQGRSTAEPIYIIRRIQDLVQAKKNQVLHLIFLDWAKAFDKVDTRHVSGVLERFNVPTKMREAIAELIRDPKFFTSMAGEESGTRKQGSGIRQGCTLSPLLFILLLSAILTDVEDRVKDEFPFATTPAVPVMDLEYADDTVLIARSKEVAEKLLGELEGEANKYGLKLNKAKTARLSYNSDEVVRHADGTTVATAQSVKYLGVYIDNGGGVGTELRARIGAADTTCRLLCKIWGSKVKDDRCKLRVLDACVVSKLIYSLHTMHYHATWENRVEAFYAKALRRTLRIQSTYASKVLGLGDSVHNDEVYHRAEVGELATKVNRHRLALLGHILRREGHEASKAVTFDRFAMPRVLGGPNRVGQPRVRWAEQVMDLAVRGLQGSAEYDALRRQGGHEYARVAELAQDRDWWRSRVKAFAGRLNA